MYTKKMTYTDYNGEEITETFHFNLTEAEILQMQTERSGGLAAKLQRMIDRKDVPSIMSTIKDLIWRAYGEKSDDGRRFIKSEELTREFTQTEAYSALFMELATNADEAARFVNEIVPKKLAEAAAASSSATIEDAKKHANISALPTNASTPNV